MSWGGGIGGVGPLDCHELISRGSSPDDATLPETNGF